MEFTKRGVFYAKLVPTSNMYGLREMSQTFNQQAFKQIINDD